MVKKLTEIAQTFSPNAPIDTQDLFAGRISQLVKVINAVSRRNSRNAHRGIASRRTAIMRR